MPPKRQPSRPGGKPPAEPNRPTATDEADVKAEPQSTGDEAVQGESAQASAGAEQGEPIQIDSKPPTPAASTTGTPAPSATGTPAPRPSATPAPTHRLASLARPSTSSPSARGASSSRGRGTIATPKFAGRRSATARAEAERAEQERRRAETEARAKEDAAKARREARERERRGRGKGDARGLHRGRGRGGYMGEREKEREVVASGPFSLGQVNPEAAAAGKRRAPGFELSGAGRGGGGGGGGGGSGGGGFGIGGGGGGGGASSARPRPSTGTGASSGGTAVKQESVKQEPGARDRDGDVTMMHGGRTTEDGGYISSDDEDAEKGLGRLNVDDLGVIDLTQDEEDRQPDPLRDFVPVRLKREVHRDRALGLNADGATTQEGISSKETAGETAAPETEKKKGKQRSKDVEITGSSEYFHGTYSDSEEELPAIKPEPTDDPEPVMAPPHEAPSSPDSRRKGKDKIVTRTLSGSAPEQPAYQTQEEIDEWRRHQRDLQILYSELGIQAHPPPADRDGDAAMAGTDEQPTARDKKADKVYLFQFPPILPDLIPIKVKPDPDAPLPSATREGGADAMDLDTQPNNASNPVTVSDNHDSTTRPPRLPSGAVGKLRIHKSGKATLDWGGTKLCLGMGAEASFLQDILVAEMPEGKAGGDEDEGFGGEGEKGRGVAMGMGQVKGKFVVTPDWEDVLG